MSQGFMFVRCLDTLRVKRVAVAIILCTSGLLVAAHPRASSSAQKSGLERIFVVSHVRSEQEQSSTIWAINVQTGDASALHTRPAPVTAFAPAMLSDNELAYFDAELASGLIFPDNWRDTRPMTQYIHQVWQVDTSRLLVLSSTDLCYVRNNGPCFGYYEFEILDLEQPNTMRSVWKLDYHPAQQAQWWGCEVGPVSKVVIADLQLHPTQDRVAFTLAPEGNCGSDIAHSRGHAYVLDFSAAQTEIVDVGSGSVSAWSPDGMRLLVFGMANPSCRSLTCEAFARIYDVSSGRPTLVHEIPYQSSGLLAQPVWLTNTQIVYQGIIEAGFDDTPNALFLYDLETGEQTSVGRDAFQDLYRQSPDVPVFVGRRAQSEEVVVFSLQENEFTPLSLFTALYLADTNNLSDYFMLYQGYDHVLAIAPDLTTIRLNLDTLVPLPEDIGLGGIVGFSPAIR